MNYDMILLDFPQKFFFSLVDLVLTLQITRNSISPF